MTLLGIGLALFIGIHMVPSIPALRDAAVNSLGDKGYQGGYSLLSLAGMILIVYGMRQAPEVVLWEAPEWSGIVTLVLMPIAFISLTASFAPSSVKSFTRHPMLWGVTIWALAHLVANGDVASLMLFAGLGFFSAIKIFLIGDKKEPNLGERMPLKNDIILVAIGLVVFALFLYFHEYVSGVSLI
ncbi:MAG: NnrU family protein [Gammaproteobacteria bacterium]|jgi:uncharacterized membrane protein|nr:NnrU family protein [Gammaproteobacteria bacterium]MBT4495031.1 NnrU family protein [Gammaproteobacteria bacterium]